MIRTLIFGAIAGYVGKKLYDEGKLQSFKDDAVTRFNQVKTDIAAKNADTTTGSSSVSPAVSTAY
ncbi:MAG: hypothetical protein ABW164_03375 [Sphingobium sp.]